MRKTREFWLAVGGIVLLGLLGVTIAVGFYIKSWRMKQADIREQQRNTPSTLTLAVLGSPYEVSWKDIAISELQEWPKNIWGPHFESSRPDDALATKAIQQPLLNLHVASDVPGGAHMDLEVKASTNVSADASEYSVQFSDGSGKHQMGGRPLLLLQRDFDPQTHILRVRLGWAFPGQETGKTCDLFFRLTPKGFVFLGQEDPNAAPAGGGQSWRGGGS